MSGPPSDGPSLTERQRRAVDAAGDVAIVAGAGTGKTHTLGLRYLALLERGASPLAIAAVTFTERAAHELRARVRRYADARLPAGDPRLDELDAAPIGTVHALCLRVCRDHPEAAGVPPDVRILDPLEGSIWTAERLEDALVEVPARLFDVMPYERVRDVLSELLRDPYRAERALVHGPEAWARHLDEAREAARARVRAQPGLDRARATLASLQGPAGDAGERARRSLLAAFAAFDAGDPDAADAALHRLRPNVGSVQAWGDRRDELRDALGVALPALRAWARDPLVRASPGAADELLAEVLGDLRDAFERARAALGAAKRRAGVVDFGDVEVAALRALGDDAVVAHYRARWTDLLVDEVQDTSPVQEAIVRRIASFCRTTVVGDAKQSIYGFRGAEARVFRRVTDELLAGGGERVVLDRSFRTHARLVERVNDVFADVLGDEHEPLTAEDRRDPAGAPPLQAWQAEPPAGTPAGVVRLAEAHRIADGILTMLAEGRPVRDPDAPGGVRPVRPGDVAVLARTWAPLDLLAEVLPARGVPALHTGGGDLLATREAQDGMAALRFLADPADDVALVALLRGPCFAVADDALEELASAAPAGADGPTAERWWDRLTESPAPWTERPREVLGSLLRAARSEPPSRLLARLDRLTGWSAVVAALPGGPRRRADRDGFVELVRDLEGGGGDVFGVTRRLRRLLRAGVEVERPALDADDAVTLTTIHRSKGLEWPVVVVASLDAGGRAGGGPVRFDPDVGVAVRLDTREERNAEPLAWTLLDAARRQAEERELRRLAYVALTRAGDLAVVSSGRASGRLHQLLFAGLEAAGIEVEAYRPHADGVPSSQPPLPTSDPVQPRDDATDVAGRPGLDPTEPGAGEAEAWDLVLAKVEAIEPDAVALLARLREAGAPAPRATLRPGRAGLGGWSRTLARWADPEAARPEVALVEPGFEGADPVAGRVVTFDATRPVEVEAALREGLGLPGSG
jgi:ATP-dependent helicase/nuclease subunit A